MDPLKLRWLQLEISSICHARCSYCPRSTYQDSWRERLFPLDMFHRIEPQLPQTALLYLQGWGEPFTHVLEFVRRAKRYGVLTGTTTNGMFIDEEKARLVVEAGLDIISFSLAGTTPTVNDRIRRGTSLTRVMRAMEQVRSARERLGTRNPAIHRSHASELSRLPQLAADGGAEKVVISTLSISPGELAKEAFYSPDEGAWEDGNEALRCTVKKYLPPPPTASLTIEVERKHLAATRKSHARCPEMATESTFIGADGKVYPCVFTGLPLTPPPPWFYPFTFGSLTRSGLSAIWMRPSYQAFRDTLRAGDLPFPCLRCPRHDTSYAAIRHREEESYPEEHHISHHIKPHLEP